VSSARRVSERSRCLYEWANAPLSSNNRRARNQKPKGRARTVGDVARASPVLPHPCLHQPILTRDAVVIARWVVFVPARPTRHVARAPVDGLLRARLRVARRGCTANRKVSVCERDSECLTCVSVTPRNVTVGTDVIRTASRFHTARHPHAKKMHRAPGGDERGGRGNSLLPPVCVLGTQWPWQWREMVTSARPTPVQYSSA
jgi:hypothetical protein